MKTKVGECNRCGSPIYTPTVWHGTNLPPHEHSCSCFQAQHKIVITDSTNLT